MGHIATTVIHTHTKGFISGFLTIVKSNFKLSNNDSAKIDAIEVQCSSLCVFASILN